MRYHVIIAGQRLSFSWVECSVLQYDRAPSLQKTKHSILLLHHWCPEGQICSLDHLIDSASISIKPNHMIPDLRLFVTSLSVIISLRLCVKAIALMNVAHKTQPKNESAGVANIYHHPTASCLSASSVLGITHSISVDGKHGFSLWQAGWVVDFTDPRLSSAFPQVQTAKTIPVLIVVSS